MIKNSIREKISKEVVSLESFGLNDLTWEKENAKSLINSLLEDDIGIFGGSVYKIDSGELIQMYDNWSCEPEPNESKESFFLMSKQKALDYISKYPVYSNEYIIFSLVFTEFPSR